jgi:hypothetical protein
LSYLLPGWESIPGSLKGLENSESGGPVRQISEFGLWSPKSQLFSRYLVFSESLVAMKDSNVTVMGAPEGL